LTVALVSLGLLAPWVSTWEATSWASEALTEASHAKLATLRESRRRHIEHWFTDIDAHVRVMSNHESTLRALEEFGGAWSDIPAPPMAHVLELEAWYRSQVAAWTADDPLVQALHYQFLVRAPPEGPAAQLASDLLGEYGRVHARHHADFRRYQATFGLYDVFLVDENGRVVYTVRKETDLGAQLRGETFRRTALARAFERAMRVTTETGMVFEDFSFYSPSGAPAAFVAAPVRRDGATVGVLVIQLSTDDINHVMTGDRQWRAEGLGLTGNAYLAGADGRFRSDVRALLEHPEAFLQRLSTTHGPEVANRVRQDSTEVLHLTVNDDALQAIRAGRTATSIGVDFFGRPVLRSLAPLGVSGLDWWIVAEQSLEESAEPVRHLQRRMTTWGLAFAGIIVIVAVIFLRMVTVPLTVLRDAVKQLGVHTLGVRVPVAGRDELAELAHTFNEMAERLEKTTVSKHELERLAARLIEVQEEERRTIARELHDDFGQRFAVLAMDLTRLSQLTARGEDVRDLLARVRDGIVGIANDLRQLSRSLHPSILDDLGLVAALESECRLFHARGLPVEFTHDENCDDLPRAVQLALYRIVQEALHNIVKHARARSAVVSLTRNSRVVLSILDDGEGFDAHFEATGGVGLSSMKERARLLGGVFTLESGVGRGTKIEVSLPVGAS
jgi:methyl-accepting chemotaxis protein